MKNKRCCNGIFKLGTVFGSCKRFGKIHLLTFYYIQLFSVMHLLLSVKFSGKAGFQVLHITLSFAWISWIKMLNIIFTFGFNFFSNAVAEGEVCKEFTCILNKERTETTELYRRVRVFINGFYVTLLQLWCFADHNFHSCHELKLSRTVCFAEG